MVADAKTVYTQFQKRELISIAEELNIEISVNTRASEIVDVIYSDINANGVSDTDDELSDLLSEFLVAAEYIDENGNVLVEQKEEDEDEVPDDKLPKCFTLADERDPSCKRCRVLDRCMKARIDARPTCYGKLYSVTDEQCKVCLEALPCSIIVSKIRIMSKQGVK